MQGGFHKGLQHHGQSHEKHVACKGLVPAEAVPEEPFQSVHDDPFPDPFPNRKTVKKKLRHFAKGCKATLFIIYSARGIVKAQAVFIPFAFCQGSDIQ
jgi:hypothetical protein